MIIPYCECCGCFTISAYDSWEICPVCFWEADPVQAEDHDYAGGANSPSVNQVRQTYLHIGASEQRWLERVRPADLAEIPRDSGSFFRGKVDAETDYRFRAALASLSRALVAQRIGTMDAYASAYMLLLPVAEDPSLRAYWQLVYGCGIQVVEARTTLERDLLSDELSSMLHRQLRDFEAGMEEQGQQDFHEILRLLIKDSVSH